MLLNPSLSLTLKKQNSLPFWLMPRFRVCLLCFFFVVVVLPNADKMILCVCFQILKQQFVHFKQRSKEIFVVSTDILRLRFHTFLLENILLLGVILVLIHELEAFREII